MQKITTRYTNYVKQQQHETISMWNNNNKRTTRDNKYVKHIQPETIKFVLR